MDRGFEASLSDAGWCGLNDHRRVQTQPLSFQSTQRISKFPQNSSRNSPNYQEGGQKIIYKSLFRDSETWVLIHFLPLTFTRILAWETLKITSTPSSTLIQYDRDGPHPIPRPMKRSAISSFTKRCSQKEYGILPMTFSHYFLTEDLKAHIKQELGV